MFKLHQPCHDKTCSCQMRTTKAFAVRCLDRVKPVLPQSRNFKNLATCSFCYWAGRFWALPGHKSPKTGLLVTCLTSIRGWLYLLIQMAYHSLPLTDTHWYVTGLPLTDNRLLYHSSPRYLLIQIGISHVSKVLSDTDWYVTALPGT